jgi:hypothetical protein
MNVTDIPKSGPASLDQAVLSRLLEAIPEMSPQLRKAARYVLDNPNDVGVSSIREVAEAAEVTANSLVRMARAVGFDGFEDYDFYGSDKSHFNFENSLNGNVIRSQNKSHTGKFSVKVTKGNKLEKLFLIENSICD